MPQVPSYSYLPKQVLPQQVLEWVQVLLQMTIFGLEFEPKVIFTHRAAVLVQEAGEGEGVGCGGGQR